MNPVWEEIAREALLKLSNELQCQDNDAHFCVRCDNSLFDAKRIVDDALSAIAKSHQPEEAGEDKFRLAHDAREKSHENREHLTRMFGEPEVGSQDMPEPKSHQPKVSCHPELFDHMSQDHGLTLTESEMDEIELIVIRPRK